MEKIGLGGGGEREDMGNVWVLVGWELCRYVRGEVIEMEGGMKM